MTDPRKASAGSVQDRADQVTVDKNMRLTTSLGAVIALVVGVWFVGRWTDQIEDGNMAIIAEIRAQSVIITDVANRQQKYIGIDGLLTVRGEEIHDEIEIIREYLAARDGAALP